MQICIIIDSKLEKSGTNVVTAEVNLVNAITKIYAAIITYKRHSTFGIYPHIPHTIVAIKNKNNDTTLFPTIEIIGITSTGNTTFFTKYAYERIEPLAPIMLSFKHIHIAIPGRNHTTYGEFPSPFVLKIN